MKLAYFSHSLASCWNHGNAHFLRGVLRAFADAGDSVIAFEREGAWSLANLLRDHGQAGLEPFQAAYPGLTPTVFHDLAECDLADTDLVIVHEWNEPGLVAALGRMRRQGARFTLLFHDTHHRAVSDPASIRNFDLEGYDGILAFGAALAAVYRGWGWGERVWVWHEAADVALFHPPDVEQTREGLIWIGNWGDGERSAELESFLLRPAQRARLPLTIHGVRYPPEALAKLAEYGAHYRGWLPNARAPAAFAAHLATVHVPRRFYAEALPGIPTIRMFEAMACGIPLVCSPWQDTEGLFRPGDDYLVARDWPQMVRWLVALKNDPALRASLAASGLETILARHTCGHRRRELLAILDGLAA